MSYAISETTSPKSPSRDKLIHFYFGIDYKIVWNIIKKELTELKKQINSIGDPDSGLHLRKEFKTKLEQRLKKPSKRISHEEVLKKFA
jgi:hypothetical protein